MIVTFRPWKLVERLVLLYSYTTASQEKMKLKLPDYVKPLATRRTRHNHQPSLAPIFATTNSYKYGFFPQTIDGWNSLPAELLLCSNFVTEFGDKFWGQNIYSFLSMHDLHNVNCVVHSMLHPLLLGPNY